MSETNCHPLIGLLENHASPLNSLDVPSVHAVTFMDNVSARTRLGSDQGRSMLPVPHHAYEFDDGRWKEGRLHKVCR